MTLTELINSVYTITGRPDRVAETSLAVQSATLKAHQSDYYYKDIFESGISFATAEFIQSLDYRALLPRWRSLKYLRKYDTLNGVGTPGKELEIVLPDNIFDQYKIEKTDICYGAGAYIQIKSSTQTQLYLMGCYLNPDVSVSGYNSWVALDQPWYIIFDAAATVFKAIGKDDEAATYRTLMAEQLAMLRGSNIIIDGY